jgi:hypothetical protein
MDPEVCADPFSKPVEDAVIGRDIARETIRSVYAELDNRERKVFRNLLFPCDEVVTAMRKRYRAADRRKKDGAASRAANRGVLVEDIATGINLKRDFVTRAVRKIRFLVEGSLELSGEDYSKGRGAVAPNSSMPERRQIMATRKPSKDALVTRAQELGIEWDGDPTAEELAQWIAEEEAAPSKPAPVSTKDLPQAGGSPPGDDPDSCLGKLYDAKAPECTSCPSVIECSTLCGHATTRVLACVACKGTGTSSTGRRCVACAGTGQAQVTSAAPVADRRDQLIDRAEELGIQWDGDPTDQELEEWIADEEKAQGIPSALPAKATGAAGAIPLVLQEFVGLSENDISKNYQGKEIRTKLKAANQDPKGLDKGGMIAMIVSLCSGGGSGPQPKSGAAPAKKSCSPAKAETLLAQAKRLIPQGWDGDPSDKDLEQWVEEEGEVPVTKQAAPVQPTSLPAASKKRSAGAAPTATTLASKAKALGIEWDGDPTDQELETWIGEELVTKAKALGIGWDGDPTNEELEQWIAEEEAGSPNPNPVDPAGGKAGSTKTQDVKGKDDCFGKKALLDPTHPDCATCRVLKRCAVQAGVSIKEVKSKKKEEIMATRKQTKSKGEARKAARKAAAPEEGVSKKAARKAKSAGNGAADFQTVLDFCKKTKAIEVESEGAGMVLGKIGRMKFRVMASTGNLKLRMSNKPKADVGKIGQSNATAASVADIPHTVLGSGEDILAHLKAFLK